MSNDKSTSTYQEIYHEVNLLQKNKFSSLTLRILRRLRLMNARTDGQSQELVYHAHFWGDQPEQQKKRVKLRDYIVGRDDTKCSGSSRLERSFVASRDLYATPANYFASNVTYTSRGYAWVGRCLDRSASSANIRSPLRFFKEISIRPSRRIKEGTIVQSTTPFTYGDWAGDQRNSIVSAKKFPTPLILPSWIGNRPYVKKDLSDLGVEYILADSDIFIRKAYVLQKKSRCNLLFEDDVQAYKAAYNSPDVTPKPGSIVYLSRGSFSRLFEMAGRNYPSEIIGRIVEELGGRVIDTNGKDRKYYQKIADEADIVIADHGGALFHIMEWKPRVVIEIVEDGWWWPCFVFLSAACGAVYHGIIRSSHRSESELRKQITEHIENGTKKQDRLTIRKLSPEEASAIEVNVTYQNASDAELVR